MSEGFVAKRALVLSGSIQSLRQIDEVVDREGIRIFENVWAKPEDWVSQREVIQGIMEQNYAPPQDFIDEERDLLVKLRKEGLELQPSSLSKMTIDRVNEPLVVKTRWVCLQCRQPHDFTRILKGNGVFGPTPICKQYALAGRKQRVGWLLRFRSMMFWLRVLRVSMA